MVNGLRHARIGAIGARPAAFQTVRYSEKLLQAAGVTVVPVDLSEIIFGAQSLADGMTPTCGPRWLRWWATAGFPRRSPRGNILKQAKLVGDH